MATKARTLYSVTASGAVFGAPDAPPIPFDRLKRPELVSVFASVRRTDPASFPADRPLSLSSERLAALLRAWWNVPSRADHVVVVNVAASVPVSVPVGADPEPMQTQPTTEPTTAPVSTAPPSGVFDSLVQWIETLAASSVTAESVQSIVADAVADALVNGGNGGTCSHVTNVFHVPTMPEPTTVAGPVHHRFPRLVDSLATGGATYLFGPPGTGKSHAAMAAADVLGIPLVGMVACSPDMMPSALRGFVDANGNYQRTAFRDAFEHGGLFIVDEADNAPPAITVGMLNTALASGVLTFPDGTVRASSTFRCAVTANTNGTGPNAAFVGRYPLDWSTLDRFDRIGWDYDVDVDRGIVTATGAPSPIVDGVMAAVVRMRANLHNAGITGFVTARGAKRAATLLAVGWSWDDVLDSCLLPAGMGDAQRRTILEGVAPVAPVAPVTVRP